MKISCQISIFIPVRIYLQKSKEKEFAKEVLDTIFDFLNLIVSDDIPAETGSW